MSQNLLSNLFRFRVSLAVQKGEEEEEKKKKTTTTESNVKEKDRKVH